MAGIDLTGIRHKTGLRVGGWIGGVRSCDEYRTGCRQSRRRGNENAAFYDESPLAGSKNNRQRPAQFPAPQLDAAAAVPVELVRDLWKQVFVPKKQDRVEQSCYPAPSSSGSLGATEPECGSETARRDTSRAVLNFIGLICLFCRCCQRINHPNV